MAKKKDSTEERIVAVEEALSKSEQFIERNQKILTYVVGGIIVVILLFFGYRKFIMLPKEKKAEKAIYKAQSYFDKDSLDLALLGDAEGNPGFLEVIDDYGSTKTGNLAKYYAGVCYMEKGEYEEGIRYLKKFSSDDVYASAMALGAIGDGYVQLGESQKAVGYYLDAAKTQANEMTSPAFLLKAGWVYETMDKWNDALEVYEKMKTDYPKARETRDIDKYIARAKAKLGEL
ncbi:MAG: tetratricopeptide repeat protein [Bacteroidales bacterium]|nr:tetratricopeptide repeat protein [Bacteroidales bacterium]